MGRWGDGEMGRWGDGEMGRWGDGEICTIKCISYEYSRRDKELALPFNPHSAPQNVA
ncbi:MAG: hypothetical protein F6K54_29335 [Okeania sp. SIO3B5]|uniref:hypothetical protein n=1 Tax=Okeania sp. SIO3B5 TaxID=2607811 RepID=UPI001400980D|nr:hypothetical protein [Okeania sp. SIO3B5]NEO56817.1 hypothetical protein [Okeania sp. SIO3B5]